MKEEMAMEPAMEPLYYPDHDKRYSHIPKSERWRYPDEIRNGPFVIRRTKLAKDLTGEDLQGYSPYFVAKDLPYTGGFCRC